MTTPKLLLEKLLTGGPRVSRQAEDGLAQLIRDGQDLSEHLPALSEVDDARRYRVRRLTVYCHIRQGRAQALLASFGQQRDPERNSSLLDWGNGIRSREMVADLLPTVLDHLSRGEGERAAHCAHALFWWVEGASASAALQLREISIGSRKSRTSTSTSTVAASALSPAPRNGPIRRLETPYRANPGTSMARKRS